MLAVVADVVAAVLVAAKREAAASSLRVNCMARANSPLLGDVATVDMRAIGERGPGAEIDLLGGDDFGGGGLRTAATAA